MEEWVRNAASQHFESFQYTAQGIPGSLIKRTELFATFECYPAIAKADFTTLRFLTTKYGILFGESDLTLEEMKAT